MRTIFTAALLASAFVTPALAQGHAPFTGPHVEVTGGWDRLTGSNGNGGHNDGFVYGVGAGYDAQVGGVILGIEGEATDSTNKVRARNVLVTGDNARVSAGRDLYIGGRIGYAVAPATLLYVKGGYTNARFGERYDNGAGTISGGHANADGYRVGAGVEQKFNVFGPGGFVKAEYRYSNYKNLNVGDANIDTDFDRHQVVGSIGVRF
ncbi:outer membrane beta-barrel protein [Sphingomonas sp.]|uniref:outer membrane protein n=1 Tax=Sphingomonas sp. TaxID=28214 RepID=UPI0025FDF1C8|nr:outer membrane beta-barrel protein [Sphingomonas sp.]